MENKPPSQTIRPNHVAIPQFCFLLFDLCVPKPPTLPKLPRMRGLFMQNKPNSLKGKTNVTSILTKAYRNESAFTPRQNKPNSNPIPPPLGSPAHSLIYPFTHPRSHIRHTKYNPFGFTLAAAAAGLHARESPA